LAAAKTERQQKNKAEQDADDIVRKRFMENGLRLVGN